MAERKFRKKEDLFIKEKRRATNFFITSSVKMTDDKNTKTTIVVVYLQKCLNLLQKVIIF